MAQLPAEFTEYTRQLMGAERFERYLESFEEPAPVSIRLNPKKKLEVRGKRLEVIDGEPVDWCREGYYLKQRPNFTMDPLFHAGCYYVQEAASMFLDEVLRQQMVNGKLSNCKCLDLCAAPGGKSTLLRSALPADCVLYSNEPIRNRASILLENVTKWGYGNHYVTNAYPKDYRKAKMKFDLILCDVPCSGEGMFRKDEATIREWSPQNVEKCWQLQREIVSDAWACLNEGGLLIYSTCTFNTKENEENIRWILEEFDAEVVNIEMKPEWNITGSLLEGFQEPVYRFIPGISRGEGLFLCVIRKANHGDCPNDRSAAKIRGTVPRDFSSAKNISSLNHLHSSFLIPHSSFKIDLTFQEAMKFLRGETLTFPPDTPRGIVEVCFEGHPLGTMKNIGTRANNLYPKEWRIKTTHISNDYEAILRHT
jgi:16S rRNA C967 or C1407 C5-methylase (RsmB/RsmF family)